MAYRLRNYTYNDKLTPEENTLLDHLYKLKLSHMAAALERQLLDPNSEPGGFPQPDHRHHRL